MSVGSRSRLGPVNNSRLSTCITNYRLRLFTNNNNPSALVSRSHQLFLAAKNHNYCTVQCMGRKPLHNRIRSNTGGVCSPAHVFPCAYLTFAFTKAPRCLVMSLPPSPTHRIPFSNTKPSKIGATWGHRACDRYGTHRRSSFVVVVLWSFWGSASKHEHNRTFTSFVSTYLLPPPPHARQDRHLSQLRPRHAATPNAHPVAHPPRSKR